MKQITTTAEYDKWFNKLNDDRARVLIDQRVKRLAIGNPGLHRFLGKIGELKIDHGPGYRVYYFDTGQEIVILLCGGDKRTQQSDIERARSMRKGNNMTAEKTEKKTGRASLGLKEWDMAKHIKTKKDVIAHLEVAMEENDIPFLLDVFGDIARSEGMTKIARGLGLSREGLYRSLAPDGNPSFETVVKLLNILGLRLRIEPKSPRRKTA